MDGGPASLQPVWQIPAADASGAISMPAKRRRQILGDTCAGCHRSARELRRASASFLRSHYTAGSDEAAAMANYLRVLAEARPALERGHSALA